MHTVNVTTESTTQPPKTTSRQQDEVSTQPTEPPLTTESGMPGQTTQLTEPLGSVPGELDPTTATGDNAASGLR